MHKDKALQIIAENKKSYNIIAPDFDITRQTAWPEFELLMPYIKEGGRILDIGCGNGRLFSFLNCRVPEPLQYVGVDQSDELIKIAQKKYPDANFRVADVFDLPFEDGEFDVVAAIAFFHHIPSKELRLAALKEIYRVLKPGGILFLTNWNLFRWEIISHNIRRNKMNPLHFFFPHGGMDAGDFWIPFRASCHSERPQGAKNLKRSFVASAPQDDSGGVPRYYHHFRKGELKTLAKKAGLKIIFYKEGRNLVAVLKK